MNTSFLSSLVLVTPQLSSLIHQHVSLSSRCHKKDAEDRVSSDHQAGIFLIILQIYPDWCALQFSTKMMEPEILSHVTEK